MKSGDMADQAAARASEVAEQTEGFAWLTVKEYALMKRVSEETVRRWLRAGRLTAQRTIEPCGHWRIRRPA